MAKKTITINEIMEKYRIPYPTVNHYTNVGLLTVVNKRKNARLYNEIQVKKRLKMISRLKGKGYTLNLIKNHFVK